MCVLLLFGGVRARFEWGVRPRWVWRLWRHSGVCGRQGVWACVCVWARRAFCALTCAVHHDLRGGYLDDTVGLHHLVERLVERENVVKVAEDLLDRVLRQHRPALDREQVQRPDQRQHVEVPEHNDARTGTNRGWDTAGDTEKAAQLYGSIRDNIGQVIRVGEGGLAGGVGGLLTASLWQRVL